MTTAEVQPGTPAERPVPAGPVRVLFIGGLGRSGSTLLDRMLGRLDDVWSVGELVHLWERGRLAGHPVQQPVQLGLGLGQVDLAAVGGQAAREGHLVVVDVLAQAVLALSLIHI